MSTPPPESQNQPDNQNQPEIIEGEVVPSVTITPLPAESSKHPGACSHGCGCGIHTLISGNLRMPLREENQLDHGELAQLFAAARRTTQMLDGHRASLQQMGERLERAGTLADMRLSDFRLVTRSNDLGRATKHLHVLERRNNALPPDLVRPPSLVAYAFAAVVFTTVLTFDYFFFYGLFTDLLRIPVEPSLREKAPAIAVSVVLPLGLILAGRLLSGAVWRLVASWRRPPGPDTNPWAHRAWRVAQITALAAFPLYLVNVLVSWAVVRGRVVQDKTYAPPDEPIIALVLLLAITTIAVEILISNPYVKTLRKARKTAKARRRQVCEQRDLAREAIGEQEHAWRALRQSRDDLLSRARTEMGRAWEQMILPARFAHGRAGDVAPVISGPRVPSKGADPEPDPPSEGSQPAGWVQDQESADALEFFSDISTPLPGLGPLNETVRRIVEYDPAAQLEEWHRICREAEAQGCDPAREQPGEDPDEATGGAASSLRTLNGRRSRRKRRTAPHPEPVSDANDGTDQADGDGEDEVAS